MNKLNINNWKTYSISEIFQTEQTGKKIQVPTGAMVSKRFLKEGSTNETCKENAYGEDDRIRTCDIGMKTLGLRPLVDAPVHPAFNY